MTKLKIFKCPMLNCRYTTPINYAIFQRTKLQAVQRVLKHIHKEHSFDEIDELLERVIVEKNRGSLRTATGEK